MTKEDKLDMFAAHALAGVLSGELQATIMSQAKNGNAWLADMTIYAFDIAERMLEESERRNKQE